ncbi:MAG: hypothetical protein R2873_19520 [Caldilineaceae bacterium]
MPATGVDATAKAEALLLPPGGDQSGFPIPQSAGRNAAAGVYAADVFYKGSWESTIQIEVGP